MGYSQENGYIPATIEEIIVSFISEINTQFGTSYTSETFVGTNHYKYFYGIAQLMQQNDVKCSEIFAKLQQYFVITNERISRPVVTNPGIIEKMGNEGYLTSVKPPSLSEAGEISVCVDADDGDHASAFVTITSYANLVSGTDDVIEINGTNFTAQAGAATPGAATFQAATSNAATAQSLADQINAHATVGLVIRAFAAGEVVKLRAIHGGVAANAYTLSYTDNDSNVGATVSGAEFSGGTDNEDYADERLEICTLLSRCIVGGIPSNGTEEEAIVLSNGQSFDFKFFLPFKIEAGIRLTITLSENNQVVVSSPDDTRGVLFTNIQNRYALGKNFEPERYFGVDDAPWAESVLLEYSLDFDPLNPGDATWLSSVYESAFDELFDVKLENIEIVEN